MTTHDLATAPIAKLSRREPGETPADRAARLLALAVAEGITARELGGTGIYAISSGTTRGLVYLTDPRTGMCTCPANGGVCKHRELAKALEAARTAPTPPACPACRGTGCERMTTGFGLDAWVEVPCGACQPVAA